jgi:hypothetical protein
MDMVNGGKIMPSGGRTGHSHGEMKVPSQAVIDAMAAASTIAAIKAAFAAWVAEQ